MTTFLDSVTPVLLTYNEAPNIQRSVSKLYWAQDVVVVDSGSTDGTTAILKEFPNVRLFSRPFDTHGRQWRFATKETGIATPWILRLDADYELSDEFIAELIALQPSMEVDACEIGFNFAIYGKLLNSSLYPPNIILLRNGRFRVFDRGHTEAWSVDGPVQQIKAHVIHDDRKPIAHWVIAQCRYMTLELETVDHDRSLRGWLRRHPPLMPAVVLFYCLFVKGLIFDGEVGFFYVLQRTTAEAILSLLFLERMLRAFLRLDGTRTVSNDRSKP